MIQIVNFFFFWGVGGNNKQGMRFNHAITGLKGYKDTLILGVNY